MSLNNTINFTLRRNLWIITNDAASGRFYTFAAKASAWPDDTQPPSLDNSVGLNDYQINNEILFGKYVDPVSGVKSLAKRADWTSGTVYAQYDDQDPLLFDKNFFVVAPEGGSYHVFKCLSNNNGAPSTFQPRFSETAADDVFYATADGYQWKYLYTIDSTDFTNFSTTDYIPVIANTSVTANAVPGALETFIITSPGGNYNSFTNGYFTDTAIGGNTLYYGLQGPDTTILVTSSANAFNVGELISQSTYGGSGVLATQTLAANGSARILTLRNVQNYFSPTGAALTGNVSTNTASVTDVSSAQISSNANFYSGSSLYISSGTGAGQIATIDQYYVTGNARRVLLNTPFGTTPDLTSKYVITPRVYITGDGTGASAIATVDQASRTITQIQVINRGSGYTYANVFIYGNTGSTSLASNNAVVRAIIPPRGGHGADLGSELSATTLGFSTTFNNTESGLIPGAGTKYRRVGIIVDPKWANVALTYSYSSVPTFPVAANTLVRGSVSNAYGYVISTSGGTNTVTLSNVSGVFSTSDVLTATYSNGATAVAASANVVVLSSTGQGNAFDQRTLLICPASTLSGTLFSAGEKVVQTDLVIDGAFGVVESVSLISGNYYIYITESKNTWQSSDLPSSSYKYIYDDATRQRRLRVDTVNPPKMVPYTGDILYTENIQPITRSGTQSETVKLILGFS